MRNTTIRFTLTALAGAFLLPSASALAQENAPTATAAASAAATPESTVTPAAAATPATPVRPKKLVAPGGLVAPTPPSPPVSSGALPAATSKMSDAERTKAEITLATAHVDELKAAVDYQVAQAQRIETRGPLAVELQGEIRRARERATDHARVQLARVEKTLAGLAAGSAKLPEVAEEIEALARVTSEGASSIAEIRTRGGRTEETLQEIAGCFEEIAAKARRAAERLADEARREGFSLGIHVDDEDGAVTIGVHSDDSDRVSYGSPINIKEGEEVNDAVAMFDNLVVNGTVLGDAVSIGGDILIGKTGHVQGDAASIFGRVVVEDGGKVDGERVSLGSGALLAGIRSAPELPQPWPTRFGSALLTGGAQFLCFFLLGLLAIAIFPRRTAVVTEALSEHPFKAGAFGVLAAVAWLPITILLVVTVVGILLIPFFWLAYPLFGFFGYVSLALIIGRRLPTKVIPTNTALLAIGAAVIVAVGFIPVLGPMIWFLATFFAIGATLMTRFGQDRSNGNASAVPGDMASIA